MLCKHPLVTGGDETANRSAPTAISIVINRHRCSPLLGASAGLGQVQPLRSTWSSHQGPPVTAFAVVRDILNPQDTQTIAQSLVQGRGFYVGVAFWPGGRVEDWLPAYDSSTGAWGLNPCNTSSTFNGTGQSDAAYLVRA